MSVILRSADGRFYELDEKVLKGKEVKPEDLPADAVSGAANGPAGGPPPSSCAPAGQSGSAVQIVIYANNGQQPQVTQGPPPQDDDVEGRGCHVWYNWYNGHY